MGRLFRSVSAQEGASRGWHRLNLGRLKWATIVLPIAFILSLDALRHTVLIDWFNRFPGFFGMQAIIAVAVIIFSFTIFGFIGRLERKIIEQNIQLSVLNEIAKDASAELDLEDLLGASLDRILSNMKADAGLICLVDTEKEEHSAVCYRGFSPELMRSIQRAKLQDDPVAMEVVRTGQPVVLEQVFDDPRVVEVARREGVRAGISTPLKSEGKVVGILALATRTEREFTQSDQQFLKSIGGQLGVAISKAVLYEEAHLRNRELSALLAVGKAVTSTIDLDQVLPRSLDTINEVTSTEAAEVWLKESGGELVMRCHQGVHREAFLERTRFRVGEGIPGTVLKTLEPIIVHDLTSDKRFVRQAPLKAGFHTFCALPLLYQGLPVGVLAVAALSKDALTESRELSVLEGIAEWLALAVEHARLYQQVQDLATVQERERLAREMHDGMAQLLGYINTQTIAVKKLVADGSLADAREDLTRMEEITRDLYADVREGILGLRISGRRNGGFIPSLREYAERYTQTSGIRVEFQGSDNAEVTRLAPSVEVQLMRIVQEALTNVRKHARASDIEIKFECTDNQLGVVVKDDGRGFDLANLPSVGRPRFGIQTMRERAEAVGGTLSIHTSPGKGTILEVRVPLTQREYAAQVR